jgi:hypothetical protein
MQDSVLNLVNSVGLAWWVEVVTDEPHYTYYFGPFVLATSAHAAKAGYVEDLEKEGAKGIRVTVRQCKPSSLTVPGDTNGLGKSSAYQSESKRNRPIFS